MEDVRGNSRAHWAVKARETAEMVDRGVEYGLVAKQDHTEYEYPLKGPLAIEITAWNTKRIDHENVLIGYKGFLDGLQMVVKRDEYGDVPGAGVIVEDSQFVTSTVKPRIGDSEDPDHHHQDGLLRRRHETTEDSRGVRRPDGNRVEGE